MTTYHYTNYWYHSWRQWIYYPRSRALQPASAHRRTSSEGSGSLAWTPQRSSQSPSLVLSVGSLFLAVWTAFHCLELVWDWTGRRLVVVQLCLVSKWSPVLLTAGLMLGYPGKLRYVDVMMDVLVSWPTRLSWMFKWTKLFMFEIFEHSLSLLTIVVILSL